VKTCLIIIGGYVFFIDMSNVQTVQVLKNVLGVSIAMAGVVGYTYFKLKGPPGK